MKIIIITLLVNLILINQAYARSCQKEDCKNYIADELGSELIVGCSHSLDVIYDKFSDEQITSMDRETLETLTQLDPEFLTFLFKIFSAEEITNFSVTDFKERINTYKNKYKEELAKVKTNIKKAGENLEKIFKRLF